LVSSTIQAMFNTMWTSEIIFIDDQIVDQ